MRNPVESTKGHIRWAALFALLVSVGLIGCGEAAGDASVHGKVAFKDGSAVSGGNVVFHLHEAGASEQEMIAAQEKFTRINEDGTYKVVELTPGTWKITVEDVVIEVASGETTEEVGILKEIYGSSDTTPLEVTVEAGEDQEYDIVVEKR